MLQGISASYPLSPSIGYAISISGHGKTSVPVNPSSYIYSHFKHVSGTPAPDGVQGVTITKLKVLDVLIDQLSKIKQRPDFDSGKEEQQMSDGQIDALIETYENRIRQAQAASAAMPYKPSPEAPAGVLFNMVVA